MTDERNFRASYYDKVGFRSVEEKRSLEILLKDRPFDKVKLKQFCLRFTVPTMYRTSLWKILLGVIPIYEESHEFIMAQRKAEFADLQKALRDAKIIDESTKTYQKLVTMWLLRNRRTKIDMNAQMDSPLLRAMSVMAQSLWNITDAGQEPDNIVDIYWVLSGFLNHIQKFHDEISRLQECMYVLLEKEDLELYNHLSNIGALYHLPYETWFYSCFAGFISDNSIAKIWDKIAVGAYKILVFVEVIMLKTLRRCLLQSTTWENITDAVNDINEETSEVIVNNAIDLWQQSGSVLVSPPPNISVNVQNT